MFKCIQQAYEELSDPLKRIMYDMELRRKGAYNDEVPSSSHRSPPPSKVPFSRDTLTTFPYQQVDSFSSSPSVLIFHMSIILTGV